MCLGLKLFKNEFQVNRNTKYLVLVSALIKQMFPISRHVACCSYAIIRVLNNQYLCAKFLIFFFFLRYIKRERSSTSSISTLIVNDQALGWIIWNYWRKNENGYYGSHQCSFTLASRWWSYIFSMVWYFSILMESC